MGKFPRISGADLIRVLERNGYEQVRSKGSHVRLYPANASSTAKKVTVPLHKELKTGTLTSILKDAGLALENIAD